MRKLVIFGLAIGLLLVLGALRTNDLWASRVEVITRAQTHSSNLALILASYMGGTFAASDAALRQLALHSQRIGGPGAPAEEWAPSLVSARAGLTGVGAISVVDRQMVIRHSTRGDIIGQSRHGEPVFDDAMRSATDDLIVGQPFLSPVVPDGYLLPIGRRLTSRDGTVEGAVVASFLPYDLRRFFQSVSVGEHGAVWVFHANGRVIFREPSTADPIGAPAEGNPIFAAAQGGVPHGVLEGPVAANGPEMVSAFRRVAGLPLIVAVSLDKSEMLAPWRRELRGFLTTYAIVSIGLFGLLIALSRQLDATAVSEQELQRARQAEAERLRAINEQLSALLEREQAARREAEQASALKDQFVMTVSHELRTPLTAIAGWARMLVDGMVGDDKKEAALKTIERNAQAQKRLIEDLLDVAGIMAGKLRLEIRPIAVAEVVHSAVEAIAPAADAKGVRLDTTVDADVGTIGADPERLQQIVWNLLANAVKFTPREGMVSLAVARRNQALHITVGDTGAGIKPELLPFVFDRFRQGAVGHAKHQGGLGLGLAIVRNLVELHGGTVSAHSEGEGLGATFEVVLPAA
ncbi:MAG TPA: ATP-binding protein [Vicinamibacterales bacterium]|nr:ATP-binding protein [Vicinamibacterales bacterium]